MSDESTGDPGSLNPFPAVSREQWRELTERKFLKGRSVEDRLVSSLVEGFSLFPLHSADDGGGGDASGMPGLPPFTRGRLPAPQLRNGWQIRQEIAVADPKAAAAAITEEADRGVEAFIVRLDRATRLGHDLSDDRASCGVDGVAIGDAAGLAGVLAPIDLASTPVHVCAGANGIVAIALLAAVAAERNVEIADLRGGIAFDPLAALARDGALPTSLSVAYEQAADVAVWCHDNAPGVRALTVSSRPFHNAGAHAVDEVAIAVASGVELLRRMTRLGLSLSTVAAQLQFEVAVSQDIFVEIAKLRALRKLWARVMEASGAEPADRAAVVHAESSLRDKTTRDPWVNMLRTTAETFAAAVGGADSIGSSPFDVAIGPPERLGRRVARNTQIILREESHLGQVADAAGGSWTLEKLTDDIAAGAWATFQDFEANGGLALLLLNGGLHERLAETRDARDARTATRKEPITGVSAFPLLDEEPVERPPVDANALQKSIAASLPDASTESLRAAVEADGGLGSWTAAAIGAAKDGVSVAAMTAALSRGAESGCLTPLAPVHDAHAYEELRAASDRILASRGRRPRIFLANLGAIPVHKARASFAADFFGAGGIEAVRNDGFPDGSSAADAFGDAEADFAVICSSDDVYADMVADAAPALKAAGAEQVFVAGRPGEHENAWRSAGVDGFIYLGADVPATVSPLLADLDAEVTA